MAAKGSEHDFGCTEKFRKKNSVLSLCGRGQHHLMSLLRGFPPHDADATRTPKQRELCTSRKSFAQFRASPPFRLAHMQHVSSPPMRFRV